MLHNDRKQICASWPRLQQHAPNRGLLLDNVVSNLTDNHLARRPRRTLHPTDQKGHESGPHCSSSPNGSTDIFGGASVAPQFFTLKWAKSLTTEQKSPTSRSGFFHSSLCARTGLCIQGST